ncbi:hypothetical protein [Streptomyces griseus]|uniref:hypothetical protein n=1 Tax=Streptomyces griseus TaxID=1911 RepID=UPI0033E48553
MMVCFLDQGPFFPGPGSVLVSTDDRGVDCDDPVRIALAIRRLTGGGLTPTQRTPIAPPAKPELPLNVAWLLGSRDPSERCP